MSRADHEIARAAGDRPAPAARAERLALRARGLSKSFDGVHALDDVDLDVAAGEIHGLLGENGSGKSTLIKILSGYHAPDCGQLQVGGVDVPVPVRPGQSRALRMAFVHQDLGLIPSLSVTENFRLGEPVDARQRLHISWRRERRRVADVLERYNVALDPRAKVSELRPIEQALLAIVRAVESIRTNRADDEEANAGLVVLDEPTAFLPRDRTEQLFALMREIAAAGGAVLLVSHDLDEVLTVTHRATILRDGRVVGTVASSQTSSDQLVRMIIGHHHEPGVAHDRAQASAGSQDDHGASPAVTVSKVSGSLVNRVSFEVNVGEVLGITGLAGSGFEELPYLLFGATPAHAGELSVGSETMPLPRLNPAAALRKGFALVPADRARDGGVAGLSVVDNITLLGLNHYYDTAWLRRGRMVKGAKRAMEEFDIRPPVPTMKYELLSGGNQQKVVLAKWLRGKPLLLLLHEPTQGVDVGARAAIFGLIRQAAAEGAAVVCASADYEQLAAICDRVLVLARGSVIDEIAGTDISKHRITEACLTSMAAGAGAGRA